MACDGPGELREGAQQGPALFLWVSRQLANKKVEAAWDLSLPNVSFSSEVSLVNSFKTRKSNAVEEKAATPLALQRHLHGSPQSETCSHLAVPTAVGAEALGEPGRQAGACGQG